MRITASIKPATIKRIFKRLACRVGGHRWSEWIFSPTAGDWFRVCERCPVTDRAEEFPG